VTLYGKEAYVRSGIDREDWFLNPGQGNLSASFAILFILCLKSV
jgi:hypothetical protein